jgi:hypothetical protein
MHSKVGQASRLPSADASRRVVEGRVAESLFGGQAGRLPYFPLH